MKEAVLFLKHLYASTCYTNQLTQWGTHSLHKCQTTQPTTQVPNYTIHTICEAPPQFLQQRNTRERVNRRSGSLFRYLQQRNTKQRVNRRNGSLFRYLQQR